MIPATEVAALAAGATVERFTIEALIGHSDSGILYRAVETRSGQPFVLREFVPAGLIARDPSGQLIAGDGVAESGLASGVAGFIAAAAGVAALNHPGLARVTRWFRANGTAYVVLPWAGPTLAEDRPAEPRTGGTCAAVARSMLDALEYLHGQGIVHREIAPTAIQVAAGGAAVLLPSGVAVSRAPAMPAARPPDLEPYQAIEQVSADGEVGPWTDIYALAATLYFCIGGRPPLPARARQQAVADGLPDPLPPLQLPTDAAPEARQLAGLIERGLAIGPAARPQTVAEWRARSGRVPTQAPASTGGAGVPVEDTEKREWLPFALLGLLLSVVIITAFYLLSDRVGGPAPRTGGPVAEPPSQAQSAAETARWQEALVVDAVVTYRAFVNEFPESIHLDQAQAHIERLELLAWAEVEAEDTRAAYEAHLEIFPEGQFVAEATARIEAFKQQEARAARELEEQQRRDDQAWEAARATGTLAGIDAYLADWPGGRHAEAARDLRQRLQGDLNDASRFAAARQAHTIAAYTGYISDYPAGRHVTTAREAIDSLTLRPGKTFRDCAECPLMVVVPAGSFWQGSADSSPYAISNEKPRRRVQIAEPFAAGVHEVTMAQWDSCVVAGGCDARPPDNGWGRGDRPVMMVNWSDAQQYTAWLSRHTGQAYSLPSESQWEYFARAGEESEWPGRGEAEVCAHGNVAGNETGFDWRYRACSDPFALETAPVGSFQANAFGLQDVLGNVAEWTLDCMNLSYLEAPADGSAWSRGMCSSRMTRGGSWFTGPKESRLAARFNLRNGDRNDFTGFRVVRRVEPQ